MTRRGNATLFNPSRSRRGLSLLLTMALLPLVIFAALEVLSSIETLDRNVERDMVKTQADGLADAAVARLAKMNPAEWNRPAGSVLLEGKIAGFGAYAARIVPGAGGRNVIEATGEKIAQPLTARTTVRLTASGGRLAVLARRIAWENGYKPLFDFVACPRFFTPPPPGPQFTHPTVEESLTPEQLEMYEADRSRGLEYPMSQYRY